MFSYVHTGSTHVILRFGLDSWGCGREGEEHDLYISYDVRSALSFLKEGELTEHHQCPHRQRPARRGAPPGGEVHLPALGSGRHHGRDGQPQQEMSRFQTGTNFNTTPARDQEAP